MDRLFDRPIICTYLAWREAKHRGSWFLLFIITTLFVLFMSLHGCTLHENIPGFEPYYYPPLQTPERLAYLDAHRSDGWPPGRPPIGWPANKLVAHTVSTTNPHIEKIGITVSSGTRQWDACSIYDGIEQSHWEQLTQPTREQKVFADVYRRFAVAHDKRWKNRTKADDLCGSPLDPQPGHKCDTDSPVDTQPRGLGYEDLYDYCGDGNLNNGDFGGGGGSDFGGGGDFP